MYSHHHRSDQLFMWCRANLGIGRRLYCSDVSNPAEELRISVASPSPQSRPPTSASGMFYQEQNARRKSIGRVTDAACFPASLEEEEEEEEDHGDGYECHVMTARIDRVAPMWCQVFTTFNSVLGLQLPIILVTRFFQPNDSWSPVQQRSIAYDARGSRFHLALPGLPPRRPFPN